MAHAPGGNPVARPRRSRAGERAQGTYGDIPTPETVAVRIVPGWARKYGGGTSAALSGGPHIMTTRTQRTGVFLAACGTVLLVAALSGCGSTDATGAPAVHKSFAFRADINSGARRRKSACTSGSPPRA
jgi:hypothetical protein